MTNTHFNSCYQKVSTLDKSLFIQIIITLSLTAIVFFCFYSSFSNMTNKQTIQMEMGFIDTFFGRLEALNAGASSNSNSNSEKKVSLDFKALNQTLSEAQVELLYNIGLFYNHPVIENKTNQSIGQIESYFGVAMIYPYSLNDRINGKVSEKEEKRDTLKYSYTLAYPMVDESLCMNFLSYLKDNPTRYYVVINNIEMTPNNGSISGDDKSFYNICKTTQQNPYNTIYLSN